MSVECIVEGSPNRPMSGAAASYKLAGGECDDFSGQQGRACATVSPEIAVRSPCHHLSMVAAHCEQTLQDLVKAVLPLPSALVGSAHNSIAI